MGTDPARATEAPGKRLSRHGQIAANAVPLTADQRALADAYARQWPDPLPVFQTCWPVIWRKAKAWGADDDDIRSACWAAVIRAAQKYDPAFGASFATYAHGWMRGVVGHLATAAATKKRAGRRVSGDAPARSTDGKKPLWDVLGVKDETDPAGDPAEFSRLDAIRERLADALRVLVRPHRQVIELRYGLADGVERTLDEVAAIVGLTRERVRQIEAKAFERLRVPLQLTCGELAGGFAVEPLPTVEGDDE